MLERSKIGGLNFTYKNIRSDKMKSVKMNRLFAKINNISEGNIGHKLNMDIWSK